MKKFGISLIFLGMVAYAGIASNAPVDGDIDIEKSVINWTGKKVTGKHSGTINLKTASLEWSDGMLSGGSFVIDMSTLACTDKMGDENVGKLEGHLKSADFFGVADHPTATLTFTKVVHRGTEGSYKIVADLTIKGITKSIKFNTAFTEENGQKMATSNIVVDRSEYDVRYGSGSFMDNLGDKTIYDEFELEVKLAIK